MKTKVCTNCSNSFMAEGNRRYCSPDCKEKANRKDHQSVCLTCGERRSTRGRGQCRSCFRLRDTCSESDCSQPAGRLGQCKKHRKQFWYNVDKKGDFVSLFCHYCEVEIKRTGKGGISVCDICSLVPQTYRRSLRQIYNITPRDYIEIREFQKNTCPLCPPLQPSGAKLVLDHDHNNMEVRGLLCDPCNKCLNDDPSYHLRAIEYLENPPMVRMNNV